MHERLVHRLGGLDLHRGPGRQRPALEAGAHLVDERVELRHPHGAALEVERGPVGDHVGRVPAVGDDRRHPVVAGQLLAQQADRHLADHDGVCRVDPAVRGGRGMRSGTVEGRPPAAHRLGGGAGRVVAVPAGQRVDHDGEVQVVEHAPFQQQHLATAVLLGRRADHPERDPQLLGQRGQRQRRGHPGPGDEVVAAGVADARQRVVLHADAHREVPAADRRGERGGQLPDAALHREAVAREHLGDRLGGAVLFEGGLRMGVQCAGQREHLFAVLLDPLREPSAVPVRLGQLHPIHIRLPHAR